MSKRKRRQSGECVNCGKVGPITVDHIPPSNLFAKPRPPNLIKVPSCKACHGENKHVSQDDEYFRNMITMRADVFNHPDVKQVLSTVLKSLARPDHLGLARSLARTMRDVEVRTPGGLHLGLQPIYDVNLARLDNVARRITQGLFYHETGYRLPSEYELTTYSEAGFHSLKDDIRRRLQANIIRPLMSNPVTIIGNGVFSYRFARTETDRNISAWLLVFYERVRFLSMTDRVEVDGVGLLRVTIEVPTREDR